MRATLGSQLLSVLTLVTVFIAINPYHSQAMTDFTSGPSLFTTAPGLLEDKDALHSQKKSNQTSVNNLASAIISPAGQANSSKEGDPLFNDTALSNSSTMETHESFANSLQEDQNATDPSGLTSLHAHKEMNAEEAGNTSHPSFTLAPNLEASPNDSDDLGSSDLWNTSSILQLLDTSQRRNEYVDNSKTTIETSSSAGPYYKIWLMKTKLKGRHLADQHRVTGKMLALFLGISGMLVCLLFLVYFIYSRNYKSEMFSHHRLYGEGFEDPVLHLDTPMDHYDFFSFSDTQEHSDRAPQQLSNAKSAEPALETVSSNCKNESGVLQMESVVVAPNKNFV